MLYRTFMVRRGRPPASYRSRHGTPNVEDVGKPHGTSCAKCCGENERHECLPLDDRHRGSGCSAFKCAQLNPSVISSTSSLADQGISLRPVPMKLTPNTWLETTIAQPSVDSASCRTVLRRTSAGDVRHAAPMGRVHAQRSCDGMARYEPRAPSGDRDD